MKMRATTTAPAIDTITGSAAAEVRAAWERMHARDRARVDAGVIKASSLHLISAADARAATVRWTRATTVRFKD